MFGVAAMRSIRYLDMLAASPAAHRIHTFSRTRPEHGGLPAELPPPTHYLLACTRPCLDRRRPVPTPRPPCLEVLQSDGDSARPKR